MRVINKSGANAFVRAMSIFLCLILIIGSSVSLSANSSKTSQQLSKARDKAKQIQKQLANSQSELKKLKNLADKRSGDLAWLNQRTKDQQKAYEDALRRKDSALIVMEQTTSEYEAAVQEFEDQKEIYGERLALMYQLPEKSILEALMSSEDLQTYFTNHRLMKIISDTDELMLSRLQAAEKHAEEMKEAAEASYEDMEKLVAEADQLLADIKADRDISAKKLKKAESALSKAEEESLLWASEMKKMEENVSFLQKKYKKQLSAEEAKRKADAEAKRKAAEEARAKKEAAKKEAGKKAETKNKKSVKASSGKSGWLWPVPSSRNITSYYGYRHIFGSRSFHYGVDIAAPVGTKIVAIKSGVVLICGSNRVSGKYVSIDHGQGIISSYRHLSGFAVKAGQRVSAGQTVGYMGSTGRSTGPHLHIDISVSGRYVNPMRYIGR